MENRRLELEKMRKDAENELRQTLLIETDILGHFVDVDIGTRRPASFRCLEWALRHPLEKGGALDSEADDYGLSPMQCVIMILEDVALRASECKNGLLPDLREEMERDGNISNIEYRVPDRIPGFEFSLHQRIRDYHDHDLALQEETNAALRRIQEYAECLLNIVQPVSQTEEDISNAEGLAKYNRQQTEERDN